MSSSNGVGHVATAASGVSALIAFMSEHNALFQSLASIVAVFAGVVSIAWHVTQFVRSSKK